SHHPIFFFSSRRRHTRSKRDWSSDVCSSDLVEFAAAEPTTTPAPTTTTTQPPAPTTTRPPASSTTGAPRPTTTDAPAPSTGPRVNLDRSTDLKASGDAVTVTGQGFSAAGPGLYVGLAPTDRVSPPDASAFPDP